MNILFLTLVNIGSISDDGIYMDLMRCFAKHGHEVYIVTPLEKKYCQESYLENDEKMHLLHCKTGDLFNVGMLKKGISQVEISGQYTRAIKKFWSDVSFDLILYSTPPVTLVNVIKKIKRLTGARTYLLLKDIFPQNAVDIGLLREHGPKSLITRYFRSQERKLYKISDYIGCMSPANVRYLIEHNDWIDEAKVEECPNSVDATKISGVVCSRDELAKKYNIPEDKMLFMYGGNLGKPQDIPHIIECISEAQDIGDAHFIICGAGTEYGEIESFVSSEAPRNLTLINGLPKAEYESLLAACDVGMVFLDHRFTIPNFPSRLLSYMLYSIPVLVCTDSNSDMGRIAEDNGFGFFCESIDSSQFAQTVGRFRDSELRHEMGLNANKFLRDHYDVETGYSIIMNHFMEA